MHSREYLAYNYYKKSNVLEYIFLIIKMFPNNTWVCSLSPLPWTRKWECQATKENETESPSIFIINKSYKKTVSCTTADTPISAPNLKTKGIPKRFLFTMMGFLGLVNCYTMRINISVAMVAMVRPTIDVHTAYLNKSSETCINLIKNQHTGSINESIQQGEFDWDSRVQHLIFAAFYFSYMSLQIPIGVIAEKYYAKHFYGIGILISSIFTLLTPIAARHSVPALIAARIMQGLGQASSWPAINVMISRWVPIMERSRISSFVYNGAVVGTCLGFALSGLLCESTFLGGWPSVFYVFGALGCIWYVFWTIFVYEFPEDHPQIKKSELMLIRKGQERTKEKVTVPWKSLLTSVPVWSLALVHFGQDWGCHTLLTEIPIYLNNVLHFGLKKNGFISALPNAIGAVVALFASSFADKLRRNGRLHITTIRKIFNSIGFYGPGVCILTMVYAGCSPTIIVILLCLNLGLNGFVYSGFNATHVDMSPEFAGTLMAITNSIANIPGFVSPIFVGWILKDGNTLQNWGIVYITCASVFFISGTIFNIFCSAELQKWRIFPPELLKQKTQNDDKNEVSATLPAIENVPPLPIAQA